MREKIKKLVKEEFQYELPFIELSTNKIELFVENGKNYKQSLFITTKEKIMVKGFVYCTCPYVKVDEKTLLGVENTLNLEICVKEKKAGERIKGELILETNCGEKKVPILLMVEKPYILTSFGKIRDLFQFTNLAKANPLEAIQVFQSIEFKNVFLGEDSKEAVLYDCLIKSSSKSHAMEEFLIAVHKKKKITIEAEQKTFFYEKVEKTFTDKVVLKKDTWGYEKITIKSNVKFLIPKKEKIWTKEFVENQYELEFSIDVSNMPYGKNEGKIEIITNNEIKVIEVIAKRVVSDRKELITRKRETINLMKHYLNFRLKKMEKEVYSTEGEAILERMGELEEPFLKDLIKIQLIFAAGKKELSKSLLEQLKEKEEQIKTTSSIIYCGYEYLKALHEGTTQAIENAVVLAQLCYNQTKKWEYLWFLLYLDKKYEVGKLKLKALLEQLELGCRSPILYYEICTLYNREPKRLQELKKETIGALHWGRKQNYISKNLALQYAELAGKLSWSTKAIYEDLKALYEMYKKDEILKEICKILIRNKKTEKRYFYWYELGVEKQLRITNLYEYYMYSLEEETITKIPKVILIYFLHNNCFNDKKKAFLYSYIVKNKENNPNHFENYKKQIYEFSLEQLKKGQNNRNLSVLYEELLSNSLFLEKFLDKVEKLMFQYEISCNNPKMKGIYIFHKELAKEKYIPLEKGKAIISLYTEGARFSFVDANENCYMNEGGYSIKKLNNLERYIEQCYEMGSKDAMLLLALSEKIGRYQKKGDNSEQIRKQLLNCKEVKIEYRSHLYKQLLEFYYDKMRSKELETLLLDEDLIDENAGQSRRIELCILSDLEKKALELLAVSEWEYIPIKRLQRLVTLILSRDGLEWKDDLLVKLSYYIFQYGKCNKIILSYLCHYYEGATFSMFQIWKKCRELDWEQKNLERLEKQILSRSLFTEQVPFAYFEVFNSYYQRGILEKNNEKINLICAFLFYKSYRYVVHKEKIDNRMFDILKREVISKDCKIAKIALLKYYSEKKSLTEEEKEFSDFQIHTFAKQNIIFPFFVNFKDKFVIPQKITNKCYIEYKANPNKKVYINYTFLEREALKFTTEQMKQIYPGIFTKDVTLFYGEELDYYIYEEEQEIKTITESDSIKMEFSEETGESRQDLLNLMLLAMELQDEKTLITSMEEYIRRKHMGDVLFWPVE